MECQTCGAELRSGARFCNVCGARQLDAEPETEQDEQSSAQADGGRVKRPPRTPRADEAVPAAASSRVDTLPVNTDLFSESAHVLDEAAASDTSAAMEPSAEAASPRADARQAAQADVAADATMAPATTDEAAAQQFETPLAASGSEAGHEDEMPALADLARAQPPDGLPWPLPVSIIVGGRYRVESLTSVAPEAPGAENTYRVTDLQGYERCWSCGTRFGDTAATDQFCRECGADLLAGEYVMVERRSPAADANADDGAPASAEAAAAREEAAAAHDDGAPAPAETSGEPAPAGDAGAPPTVEGQAAPDERRFTQGGRAYRVFPRVSEPARFPLGARLVAAAATDVGKSRPGEHNEDSAGILQLSLMYDSHALPLALCVVADGLGGHATGQDASRLVVRTLTEHVLRAAALPLLTLTSSVPPPDDVLRTVLREGSAEAHAAVRAANAERDTDMGSTLVAALVCGEVAHIANVGDSRAYVYEQGALRRITTDHSLVEQLVEAGNIEPDQRYTHPRRNQIYKSLGDDEAEDEFQADIFVQRLQPGMRLLLCSDGLWELVRDPDMARILSESAGPQATCEALVRQANENGGEDNITAIVLEVVA
jgi:serine/threonine protein phosphatase PrpC